MLPFAFALLGKNFFEPMCLTLSHCLIHKCRLVEDDKSLTAMVAAKSTHLCKGGRTLSRLTFLYRYCSHRSLHSIGTFESEPVAIRPQRVHWRFYLTRMTPLLKNHRHN